jgi:hypothetical protein
VVFKKPGYEEAEQPLVPKSSGPLNASLRPTPPPAQVEAPSGHSKPGKSAGRRTSSASQSGTRDRTKPGGTGRRGGADGQPGTGDDVLMPDFLKK